MNPASKYLVIVGLITVGAFILAIAYFKHVADSARNELALTNARLEVAEAVNKENVAALNRVAEFRKHNEQLLTALVNKVNDLNQRSLETKRSIDALATTNDEVKAYLSGTLPLDLRQLLNTGTVDKNSGGK